MITSNINVLSKEHFDSLGKWIAWINFNVEGHEQAYKTSLLSLDGTTWECSGGIGFADAKFENAKYQTHILDEQIWDVVEQYESGTFGSTFNAALNEN